mgnify:CR=1 FL=1
MAGSVFSLSSTFKVPGRAVNGSPLSEIVKV